MVKDNKSKSLSILRAELRGPLPHPDILAKYEILCKGSTDRILSLAENQSKHRQNIEKSQIKHEFLGMIFAVTLTLILMAIGFYLIINDKQYTGFISLFSPVIFHAGNYIYNKRIEIQNTEDKQNK